MSDYSFIDLHIHTTHSKEAGCVNSVEETLQDAQKLAERIGKKCLISITDHNCIGGSIEAKQLVKSKNFNMIELVNGIEISVDVSIVNKIFSGQKAFYKCHILAYGYDETNAELLKVFGDSKSCLSSQYPLPDVVRLIKNAGGKLVIAHPGLIKLNPTALSYYTGKEYQNEILRIGEVSRTKRTLLKKIRHGDKILKVFYHELKKYDKDIIIGMERFHPDNYEKHIDEKIEAICKEEHLIQTAGSDYHGLRLHPQFSIGNPFTQEYQEFFKKQFKKCHMFRNGVYISHLPCLELLTNSIAINEESDQEIKLINALGEELTYEQYKSVRADLSELHRKMYCSNTTITQKESQKENN